MKALVLLLASLLCLGEMPAGAQDQESEGIKVYGKKGVIYKSNLDGSGEQKLTEGTGPALSPDQNTVAFTKSGELYLLDLATMVEEILVEYGPGDPGKADWPLAAPFWHPRGSTIFVNAVGLFRSDIYAVEKDGTNFRLVVGGGAAGGLYDFLSWPGPFSPDGHYLLYTDCHDACETLRVVDLRTGNRVRLSERTSYGAWAPNGRLIAFGGGADDLNGKVWPGLFVADPGGAQVRTVLEDVWVDQLSWSSDSRRIAFTQVGDGGTLGVPGGIYEVGLDGTGMRSRDAHFDKWEHALDSTTAGSGTSERTWGQVKEELR